MISTGKVFDPAAVVGAIHPRSLIALGGDLGAGRRPNALLRMLANASISDLQIWTVSCPSAAVPLFSQGRASALSCSHIPLEVAEEARRDQAFRNTSLHEWSEWCMLLATECAAAGLPFFPYPARGGPFSYSGASATSTIGTVDFEDRSYNLVPVPHFDFALLSMVASDIHGNSIAGEESFLLGVDLAMAKAAEVTIVLADTVVQDLGEKPDIPGCFVSSVILRRDVGDESSG